MDHSVPQGYQFLHLYLVIWLMYILMDCFKTWWIDWCLWKFEYLHLASFESVSSALHLCLDYWFIIIKPINSSNCLSYYWLISMLTGSHWSLSSYLKSFPAITLNESWFLHYLLSYSLIFSHILCIKYLRISLISDLSKDQDLIWDDEEY